MKIDPLPSSLTLPSRGASSISFTRDDFAGKLTLGQIIKGRVLRSYEGSRYLVDFTGQEKVVDSAVPLAANEVIVGRVVALNDRVELQRINTNAGTPSIGTPTATAARTGPALSGKSADLITGLFGRFQADLATIDAATLQRAVERAPQPETMAMSGLLLSRLGLPLSADALRAVFDALRADAHSAMFALPDNAIRLETKALTADAAAPPEPTAPALGGLLANLLNSIPEMQPKLADPGGGDAGAIGGGNRYGGREPDRSRDPRNARNERDERTDIARLILNVQSGGAVAHRVGTLPLFVDGRLVELNVALFEEPDAGGKGSGNASPLKHRQVVFSVTTELLGRIEVRAAIAGTHMRVSVSADKDGSAQYLARHAARLTGELEGLGWEIDELAYETRLASAPGAVAQTVLEHLVAPGSVSALA